MSAYSNMPWIDAVRAAGGTFVPISTIPGDWNRGWVVGTTANIPGWEGVRYLNVHAVERDMTRNAAERLADRLNKGYNR